MKKRVLAGLMMMVMVLAFAMSATAAPSATDAVVESGASVGFYDITTGEKQFAKKDNEDVAKHTAAIKIVTDINAGKKDVKITDAVDKVIEGKTLVAKFFDLDEAGKPHAECEGKGYHTVTLYVAGLSDSWKNITLVHYSQTRQVWETITSDGPVGSKIEKVDYDKKTITFQIKDLSPLAIYADVVEDNKVGTSAKTEGVSSAWMLYTAMALIVLGAGVVVYQKKRG